MIPAHTYTVAPRVPKRLEGLTRIAMNLWWTWNPGAIELFRRLDRILWERCYGNPIRMLGMVSEKALAEVESDESYLAHLVRIESKLSSYLSRPTWFSQAYPESGVCVAYFCAEFGIVEGIRLYSGGLGVLAGDHLKSASDLGIPLVAVGLLYREGYFRQYLTSDGWQQEQYPHADFYSLPITLERDDAGGTRKVVVELGSRRVEAQIWRAQVGRIPLYLLDCDLESNTQEDRAITSRLYGGDLDMRIRQELVLGVGGLRALAALGTTPTVCHLNEGHSAFLTLERARSFVESKRLNPEEALELVSASTVFTTHTPVHAGIDLFPADLMDRYLGSLAEKIGISRNGLLAMGRRDPSNPGEPFSMAVLAIRLSGVTNGVSQLHARVSRRMWAGLWPRIPENDTPIHHITNGIHVRGWLSHDMAGLFDAYLGPRWISHPADQSVWEHVEQIPDAELWRTHERRRERLVAFARRRLRTQLEQHGASAAEREQADEILDPKALTIGFARRFATYKRATLLFRDPERLGRILNNPDRPVQVIFAGKAHPADQFGKEYIRQVLQFARRPEFRQRVVFLEDYDIKVGRYLYQGVDVWLNTPRRPLEASGTSGMKATSNGALNISVLDGWWDEAYDGSNGWAIGHGEEYEDGEYQDHVESRTLYQIIEGEVAPTFYARGRDGLPREWIRRMKRAMRTICPTFNAYRMVKEYTERFYLPAAWRWNAMTADSLARLRSLSAWKARVQRSWKEVSILEVASDTSATMVTGETRQVRARIRLGSLRPEDVAVELYSGLLKGTSEIVEPVISEMKVEENPSSGVYLYSGPLAQHTTGLHGFWIRVLPMHEDLGNPLSMNCVAWG